MLARKNRLNITKDYKRVEEKGVVFQSDNFGLAIYNRQDEEPSRFGFVISTKIAKAAVDRNRVKRAMSEAVRTSTVYLKDGFDAVFLAKTSIIRISTVDIMKEVKMAMKESGVLK